MRSVSFCLHNCVSTATQGDNHIYPTVPALVVGFSAGLQVPLEHPVHKLKQQIFAIAEQELQRELEAADDDKYAVDFSSSGPSSFRDPADNRGGLPSRESQFALGIANASPAAQRHAQQQQQARAPAGGAGGRQRAAATSISAGSSNASDKVTGDDGGVLVMMPDSKAVKGGSLEGLVSHLLENTASKFAKWFVCLILFAFLWFII